MKRLLTLMLVLLCTSTAFAQLFTYNTTAFYSSVKTGGTWSNWTKPVSSNIGIVIDLDEDMIYIDSKTPQLYKITSTIHVGYDAEGCPERKFGFIDQDGDRGILRLVKRKNGTSQIYIIFNDVRWCYDVIFLN